MLVDESLAKGLVKLLIKWWPEDVQNAVKKLRSKITPSMLDSRKGLEKVKKYHREIFEKFAISYLEGGSKRKPYIGLVGINVVKERNYNDWSESGFFGEAVITNFYNGRQFSTSVIAPFAIGQHALARVFQRSKLINENNRSDPYSIIPELKMIPLWSGFWVDVFRNIRKTHGDKYLGLKILIPSPNGLFFSEISENEGDEFLEIRTYVHKSQLTDQQVQLRDIFESGFKGLESSLLSITPALPDVVPENVYFNELGCLLMLIKYRLKDNIDDICQMLVGESENFKFYEIKKIVKSYLVGELMNEKTADYLEHLLSQGYEKYANEFIHPSPEMDFLLKNGSLSW